MEFKTVLGGKSQVEKIIKKVKEFMKEFPELTAGGTKETWEDFEKHPYDDIRGFGAGFYNQWLSFIENPRTSEKAKEIFGLLTQTIEIPKEGNAKIHEDELIDLKVEIRFLKKELEKKDVNKEMNRKIKELDQEIEVKNDELRKMNRKVEKLDQEIDAKDNKIKKIKREIEMKDIRIEELVLELEHVSELNYRKDDEIQQLKEELGSFGKSTKKRDVVDETEELKKEIEKMKELIYESDSNVVKIMKEKESLEKQLGKFKEKTTFLEDEIFPKIEPPRLWADEVEEEEEAEKQFKKTGRVEFGNTTASPQEHKRTYVKIQSDDEKENLTNSNENIKCVRGDYFKQGFSSRDLKTSKMMKVFPEKFELRVRPNVNEKVIKCLKEKEVFEEDDDGFTKKVYSVSLGKNKQVLYKNGKEVVTQNELFGKYAAYMITTDIIKNNSEQEEKVDDLMEKYKEICGKSTSMFQHAKGYGDEVTIKIEPFTAYIMINGENEGSQESRVNTMETFFGDKFFKQDCFEGNLMEIKFKKMNVDGKNRNYCVINTEFFHYLGAVQFIMSFLETIFHSKRDAMEEVKGLFKKLILEINGDVKSK